MLTAVERVLVLKYADMLKDVGPRHLLALAERAHEVEMGKGDLLYGEEDPGDVLYIVVEGRIRLAAGDRMIAEVGANEAFGTWALVDDSARGQRAECVEDGLVLALHREDFYDVAAGDLTLLMQVVRALAKRLRALVAERPEEARVEGEGIEKPEALVEAEAAGVSTTVVRAGEVATPGEALASAALGQATTPPAVPEEDAVVPGEPPPVPPGAAAPVKR